MKSLPRLIVTLAIFTVFAVVAGCSDDPTAPGIDDGAGDRPPAPTTGFFVDQATGDDANDGAIDRPFKTISAAIAVADSGDTIVVAPGTYGTGESFPLRLPRGLFLIGDETNRGDGAQPTRISGGGAAAISSGSSLVQEVTLVGAAGAQVRGFLFTHTGAPRMHFSIMMDGGLAGGASGMVVKNNTFAGVYGGIVSLKADGSQITGNAFDTGTFGAWIVDSDQVVFDRNHVTSAAFGVDLSPKNGEVSVRDNEFFVSGTSGNAIRTQSGTTRIEDNIFTYTGGGSDGSTGLHALAGNSVLRSNTFDTHRGIVVYNFGAPDAGTTAEGGNNDFSGCEGPAIEHNGAGTAKMHGNTFRNSPPVLGDDIVISGTGIVEGPYRATFWVDPGAGDDANPGTEAEPFRTITHALSSTGGIPTLHLATGAYGTGETFPLVFPAGSKIIGASTDSFGRDLTITGEGAYEIANFDGATIVALGDIEMERVSVRGGSTQPSFYFALAVDAGTATLRNCEFRNAYGGVLADFDVTLVDAAAVHTNTGAYGIYASNVDYYQCYLTSHIPYNARSGSISNSVITISSYSGAAQTNGTVEVAGCAFRYSPVAGSPGMTYGGIYSSFGTPRVRYCSFETPVGVMVKNTSRIDLGAGGDPGNNTFTATETGIKHGGSAAITAIGNTWVNNPPLVGSDIVLEGTGTVDTGTTN